MPFIQSHLSKRILFSLFLTCAIFTPSLLFGQGQNRIKLTIAPIINNTKLAYVDTLSDTVQENILFTGNMITRFKVIDKSGEKLTSITNLRQLEKISDSTNSDYLITGMISRTDTGYTLTLTLYNADTEEIQTTKEAQFSRSTEIFDISDTLGLALFEELTGTSIKKERIVFINNTPGSSYLITVNGRKLEENISTISLVEGEYTVKIFNTSVSPKKKVLTTKIEVKQGFPQRINFDLSKRNVQSSKRPNKFNKKNTIRIGTGIGLLLAEERISTTEDTRLTGWIADLPEFYYTRLITDSAGFTFGASIFPSINLDSVGFKVKAGPHFRLGRWGLNPMLGYGFVYSSSEQHSLEAFQSNTAVSPEENDYMINWGEAIVMVDFFFVPGFSIYAEVAFTMGYVEEHNGGNTSSEIDAGTYSDFAFGFSCALGVGFSF